MWAERRPDVPLELVAATTDEAVDADPDRRGGRRPGPAADRPDRAARDPALHRDHGGRRPEGARPSPRPRRPRSRTWPTRSSCTRGTTPSPGPATGREGRRRIVPATTAEAIELVAAGVGVLVVPQSLARLHHRRDLAYRPLTDAPQSTRRSRLAGRRKHRADGGVHRDRPRPHGQQLAHPPSPGRPTTGRARPREEGTHPPPSRPSSVTVTLWSSPRGRMIADVGDDPRAAPSAMSRTSPYRSPRDR